MTRLRRRIADPRAVLLRAAALGFALAECDRGVRESRPNGGGRIDQYRRNVDPPIHVDAPWCAMLVQYASDGICRPLGIRNPLDEVKLEALVQSYYFWAEGLDLLLSRRDAQPGHLVMYRFGDAGRWNHIGLLATPVREDGSFEAVEGNTNSRGGREGVEVAIRPRNIHDYPVAFAGWDLGVADPELPAPDIRIVPSFVTEPPVIGPVHSVRESS